MPDLPTGTVTFLFTDIEGSTKLWGQHPEAMKAALARHDALLRSAIEAQGGYVFKTVGDAFCAAFNTAPDALTAALAVQRALQTEVWGETGPLRVRMALHTGAAEEREGDYFGPPLNRVARLLSAGYGGQVLLSQTTYDLVRDALPAGASLRDLGEHRLKDLQRPERISQLIVPDLPADFPSLKTLDRRPHNLPAQVAPLVGREKEIEAVRSRLLRPEVRLLTLTGPGGTGKTRLALQVAAEVLDDFEHGAFFVALAPLSDPGLVVPTVAQTLGLKESAGQPVVDLLKDYLRDRALLLILDNFEQVLAAASGVAALLAAGPKLKVLVTSRAVLRVYGEHEFPVPPLSLPDPQRLPPPECLRQYEAVRLFIERALAVKPDFAVTNDNAPAVAEICRRLDGLPLAIELAAARIRLLPPQAMLARLERRLPLLTGGARDLPARQQTLRNAIAWGYDLLGPEEQTLFRRLAVFVGGCTLEAAEAVGGGSGEVLDGIESLVSKSLLRQEEGVGGEPRFAMLETIREFALERLEESDEAEVIRRQHAAHYLALAEQAESELKGSQQLAWLERLEGEHDNLRAALRWSMERGETEYGLRLGGALGRFWWMHGYLTEGRAWLAALLALPGASSATAARAMALFSAGGLAFYQGDYEAAYPLAEESVAIWRQLGDRPGIALSLIVVGNVASGQGDYAEARAFYEESLAIRRGLGDRQGIALSLNNLGNVAAAQGDDAKARGLYEESLAIWRQLGSRYSIAFSLNNLGDMAIRQGDCAEARSLCEESLAIRRQLGSRLYIASSLSSLGNVATAQGDYAKARAFFEESLVLQREVGAKRDIAKTLEGFADLAAAQGQAERALRLAGAAAALREAIGAPLPPAEQAWVDRRLEPARQALSEKAQQAAWEEGRAMTLEQAVEYASSEAEETV